MDEPKMADAFKQLKKRDLFQTYRFKMAVGSPKCRKRILIAKPPSTLNERSMYRTEELRDAAGGRARSSRVVQEENIEENTEENTEWFNKRRDLRQALDGLGDLDSWFHNKPNLTQMESHVMEGRKEIHKNTQSKELLNEVHGGIQSKKALVQNDHVQLSPIDGATGCAVDHFRTRCMEEYLGCLKQCQRHGLSINQAALKRVLVHPEDVSTASALPGQGKERRSWLSYSIFPQKEMEDDSNIDSKEISQRVDSNAFWPGHDGHVRLYLPLKTDHHTNVLFNRIEHNPVPCHGHWPINHAGYYTSGDINRHKVYTL